MTLKVSSPFIYLHISSMYYNVLAFIQHLTTTNCGLFEDDELFDSYRGIKNDIKVINIY